MTNHKKWRVINELGALVITDGKKSIAELWRRGDNDTEIANAHLIASAPELLDELKCVVGLLENESSYIFSQKSRALAVIAKAEGGAV